MKQFYLSILTIIISGLFIKTSSQSIDHWESIVLPYDNSKYFVGDSAPDVNWKAVSFDDASWLDGKCSIGYGDGDDSTIIDQVLSVYLRVEFNITDISKIEQAILNMDYDDAFVAYLNGIEIARANIGTEGIEPSYDQKSTSGHDAIMYQGGTPETFTISNEKLFASLQLGKNVLSIQAHNVEETSTDMSCIIFFSVGINDATSEYRDTPEWFVPPFEEFISSNLPIIIINTEGNSIIPTEPKIDAQMNIIFNENGQRNYVDGAIHSSSGPIGIETRGNVTEGWPKKPFGFETRNSIGENRNVELLGLPAENDWILRACYIDRTLMRNAISSHISNSMGRYTSRYAFCELIINGSYEGVYMLMEKIKWDDNRLNIDKLFPWTTDRDSITGGYIYEVAQSGVDFGERRRYKYPIAEDINTQQANYIKDYDDGFRETMEQYDYDDPYSGYPMLIDVNSFIDEMIIQESTKNSDAYGWSSYFHKDRLRKLAAGPAWDFDQSLSNSSFNEGNETEEWLFDKGLGDVPDFWKKLYDDRVFRYLLKKRWFELRENVLHTDTLMKFIDATAEYLDEAQQRNFQRWPILGEFIWRELPGYEERDTYQKEVDYMKDWFAAHLDWIDEELSAVGNRNIDIPDLVISEIMYAPFSGMDFEFIEILNKGTATTDLTGVFFEKGITFTFPEGTQIAPGEYLVVASDAKKFKYIYGFEPFGEFYGQLDNAGERIVLQNSLGCEIDNVRYNDKAPWPVIDSVNPGSIEILLVDADNSLPENWKHSEGISGTPGYSPTNMENMISVNGIKVYPNPATDYVNITMTDYNPGTVEIKVFDLLGKPHLSQTFDNFRGAYLSVDIGKLENGHYIVKMKSEHFTTTKKLIVAR